jgi:hypothetical protein
MAVKPRKLGRALIRFLAALGVLAAFAVLDWYPTVKDLGQLRRERGDMERRVKDCAGQASRFDFPNKKERKRFARGRIDLKRALPGVDDDAAWLDRALPGLRRQAAADRIARAQLLVSPAPASPIGPGTRVSDWLAGQLPGIREGFKAASAPERYPWSGVLPGPGFGGGQHLAGRPLAVALSAPLPTLLNFINHCSWGEVRLEIVRLRLEACAPMPRAWLVLRGYYLVHGSSPWAVPEGAGSDDGLLVDPDSPLLWQRADPGSELWDRKELPPACGSRA